MLEDERRWSKCDDNNRTREFENMSAWRVEDCPAYADTYIEWCFEKRCKEYGNECKYPENPAVCNICRVGSRGCGAGLGTASNT